MKIEVSIGEVVDKLTILSIKKDRITDSIKLQNVIKEHDYLLSELESSGITKEYGRYQELLEVNLKLWDIEDKLRALEAQKSFNAAFIALAREVYITNDRRAEIKKAINTEQKSEFTEEKSYQSY